MYLDNDAVFLGYQDASPRVGNEYSVHIQLNRHLNGPKQKGSPRLQKNLSAAAAAAAVPVG